MLYTKVSPSGLTFDLNFDKLSKTDENFKEVFL